MPKITLARENKVLEAANGDNLREVLLRSDVNPYRGATKILNCHGRGECKTCKVKVHPESNASPRTPAEFPRASGKIFQLIDHRELIGWRLSCQVKIRGDVTVTTQA